MDGDGTTPLSVLERRPSPILPEPEIPGRQAVWPAGAGVVLLGIGQLVDWGWYVDFIGQRHRLAPWVQTSDGFLAFVAAVALAVVLRSRSLALSGSRAAQVLPLLIGAVSVLVAMIGYREASLVATYEGDAGQGSGLDVGMWATLSGAALAAAAGAVATRYWLTNAAQEEEAWLSLSAGPILELILVVASGLGALAAWAILAGGENVAATLWLGVLVTLCGPIAALWLWHRLLGIIDG